MEWLGANNNDTELLYLDLPPQTWVVSARGALSFPLLNCTHEAADDIILFRMQYILSTQSGPTAITVSVAQVTQICLHVCLLYHIADNWRDLGLKELWLNRNPGVKSLFLLLHNYLQSPRR